VRSNLSLRVDVRKVAKERVGMPDFVFAAETEDTAAAGARPLAWERRGLRYSMLMEHSMPSVILASTGVVFWATENWKAAS
jgi:hypothetical protein